VLAVAGSPGKSGAAALVIEAALRAGAGLVTLAARPEVLQTALPGVPEAMGFPLPGSGPLGQSDLGALRDALKGKTALAIGPGIARKGARTVVGDPEGATAICAHGNPGMATAGAGDVLTGIAAAVLARRSGAGGTGERARLAVLLHALAGDLAVRRTGQAA